MSKTFKILQIDPSKGKDIPRFFGFDFVKDEGFCEDWYKEVWTGTYDESKNTMETLEDLFREFNINHPEGFRGHSLSISDIVLLDGVAYYCDDFGWTPVPGFEWKTVICL